MKSFISNNLLQRIILEILRIIKRLIYEGLKKNLNFNIKKNVDAEDVFLQILYMSHIGTVIKFQKQNFQVNIFCILFYFFNVP